MKITAIDCHVLLIPAAREDATDSALQHGQSGLLAVPQLGSCTSSLCAWRLWAARHSATATASGARAHRLQSRRFHRR